MALLILDKDGTLTKPKSGGKFPKSFEDQVLRLGVVDGLKRLTALNTRFGIATNQCCVEAGFKTVDEAKSEVEYCIQLLAAEGIAVEAAALCPDFDGKICHLWFCDWGSWQEFKHEFFRKPGGGMLNLLAEFILGDQRDREFKQYTGDRPEDRAAAVSAGFEFLEMNVVFGSNNA